MTKQASRMASDQLQSIQHPVPLQKLANSRRITVLERELLEEQQKRERESKRPTMVNRKQQYRMSDVVKDDPDFSEEEATEIITREIALERK